VKTNMFGIMVAVALSGGLLGGLVGSWLAAGGPASAEEAPPSPHAVTAESFVLVDKQGKARATLSPSGKGEPRLEFLDKDQKPLAVFGLTDEGSPEMELHVKGGKANISLLFKDGNPRVLLGDKEGRVDAVLSATPGEARLVFYRKGKARASLDLNGLDLLDEAEHARASLRLRESGEPSFEMKDRDGHRLIMVAIQPLPKKEEPLLALYDRKEALRAGLSLDEGGRPSLILRDRPLLSLVDKAGEDGLFLSLEKEERPSLLLTSKKGKHSAFLGLRESKEMALDLMDNKNKHRASLLLSPDGQPALTLRNEEEKVIWSAPPSTDR
jgi:hypothetical protein